MQRLHFVYQPCLKKQIVFQGKIAKLRSLYQGSDCKANFPFILRVNFPNRRKTKPDNYGSMAQTDHCRIFRSGTDSGPINNAYRFLLAADSPCYAMKMKKTLLSGMMTLLRSNNHSSSFFHAFCAQKQHRFFGQKKKKSHKIFGSQMQAVG